MILITWIELEHSNHMIIESTIQFIYLCATEKSWQISHELIHQLDFAVVWTNVKDSWNLYIHLLMKYIWDL